MAKFCGNCGMQLNDDAKVCENCATPVANVNLNTTKTIPEVDDVNSEKKGKVKGRFRQSIFATIGAVLLFFSGFMPLTRTNLGFWSGGDTSYEFGIVFVIAGLIGIVLVLFRARKLFLIPAIVDILGLLFFKGILNVYGSLIEYTFWYYLLWVGSILLIVQAFVKREK